MARIILTGVFKNFPAQPTVEALGNVNLEIRDREFFVVAGPVNAGKSTLLRVIAGLEEISSGKISTAEEPETNQAARQQSVAMVFAGDSLYPAMTVYENIAFGLKLRHFENSRIERQVRDAAAALGLSDVLERKPGSLSFEQHQRTALARAIARQPKLLLLDEPFARIDANRRADLRSELRQLHDRLQTTTICATADPLEAFSLADRAAILQDGAVIQVGRPVELYDSPDFVSVGKFFGSLPMNFVRGELKREKGGLHFVEDGDGTIVLPVQLPNESESDSNFLSKSLLLGIWPEEMELAEHTNEPRDSALAFPVIIEHLELREAETILSLQTGAHTIMCRSRLRFGREKSGRRTKIKLNIAKLRLFDALSGKRIF